MSGRSYVVGLPVIVTVREDGGIGVEVDMSEASSEMSENFEDDNEDGTTEDEMLRDSAILDAHPASWTINVQPAVAEMKCPVRYGCGFRTFEIPAMCAHIADPDEKHGDH